MSHDIDQIIHQAKKQAKQEKVRNFLHKHKKLIISSAAAVTVLAVLFIALIAVQNIRAKNFSVALHESLLSQQEGNFAKAEAQLKLIYESHFVPGGIKSVVMLRYAAFLLNDGKFDDSIKVYQELHNCFSCNEYAKDLAGLLVVKAWMSKNEELSKPDLVARIKKIEKSSGILVNHVAEQRALLEMNNNNLAESYKIFAAIAKSEDVFPALKERAEDNMKILIEKGYNPQVVEEKSAAKKDSDNKKSEDKK